MPGQVTSHEADRPIQQTRVDAQQTNDALILCHLLNSLDSELIVAKFARIEIKSKESKERDMISELMLSSIGESM